MAVVAVATNEDAPGEWRGQDVWELCVRTQADDLIYEMALWELRC